MTKEQAIKGNSLVHKIEMNKKELNELKAYNGNGWWIGYGQDAVHKSDLTINKSQFELIRRTIVNLKELELEQLEKELNEL